MKSHQVLTGFAIATSVIALAVADPGNAPAPAASDSVMAPDDDRDAVGVSLSEKDIDELLAPLALYPDPLIAIILPAATAPSDVVLASRYLTSHPKSTAFDDQPWEDAARSLARYPEVIKWLDENLGWTKRLGEAFLRQPVDVMNGIQRLRAKARASGALASNSQQTVVEDSDVIRIVPAQADLIFVPRYDPFAVYMGYSYAWQGPLISFGIGFPLGYWAAYDCDWHRHRVCVVGREYRIRVWNDCRIGRIPLHDYRADHRHAGQWNVWRSRSIATVSNAHRHPQSDGYARRVYPNQRSATLPSNPHSWNSSSGVIRPQDSRSTTDVPSRVSRQPGYEHGRVSRDPHQTQTLPLSSQARTGRSLRGSQTPQPGDANFMGPVTTQDRQRAQSSAGYRRTVAPAPPQSSRNSVPERSSYPTRTESPPTFRRESISPPAQARAYSGRSASIDRPTVQHVD